MSLSLRDSPFQDGALPCIHCAEQNEEFWCTKNYKLCVQSKTCNEYCPIDRNKFHDNMKNSLKPMWVRRYHGDSYSEECSSCGCGVPRNMWNQLSYASHCPDCGKQLYLEDEEVDNVEPGIYQHFKGRQYMVLGVATHSETGEKVVVYKALYDNYETYVRPLKMFVEDIEDLRLYYRGPRFYKINKL